MNGWGGRGGSICNGGRAQTRYESTHRGTGDDIWHGWQRQKNSKKRTTTNNIMTITTTVNLNTWLTYMIADGYSPAGFSPRVTDWLNTCILTKCMSTKSGDVIFASESCGNAPPRRTGLVKLAVFLLCGFAYQIYRQSSSLWKHVP